MACFLVPAAEAVVVTIVTKAMQAKAAPQEVKIGGEHAAVPVEKKLPFYKKLKWLTNLLWGGAVLLAFEHVWHGEVVPYFPFLTAASDPADAAVMLHEMSTVGVTMALLVTAVWLVMVAASSAIEKREAAAPAPAAAN